MGARGPTPKRSEQRLGHRTKAEQADKVQVTSAFRIPPTQKRWHTVARKMYDALRTPELSRYMLRTDWATAVDAAETLSIAYESGSAEMFKVADRKWDRLLMTEAGRRRAGIEVERDTHEREETPESASDHRSRLSVVS